MGIPFLISHLPPLIYERMYDMPQYFSPDKGFSKEPESYWIASTVTTNYPALEEDITVDVAVIGGGVTGITTGFLLKKEGLNVAVIEANRIGDGTTGHTTAKITSQHDLIYDKLITQFGMEKAKQYADSNEGAIKLMTQIVQENNIDCDFKSENAYVFAQSDDNVDDIKKEVKAAQSLGIKASYTEQLPLPFPIKAAVQFEGQAQFHPRKYLLAVADKLAKDGGRIFENTRAVGIEGGQKCTVTLQNGKKITASKVVIATHYPFSNIRGLYVLKIFPERTYALAVKARSKFLGGMYINVELPTRSLRSIPLDSGGELILIVGETHKTGQGEDFNIHYKNLIDFAHQNFDVEEIQYRWSAQDYMTSDNIPIIGNITANEPNIYVATGFKKWGITTGAVSAMVLKDLIVKNQSPWAEVYNPSRFTDLDTIWKSVEKNLNALKNGEGKAINIAERNMGTYKDDKGKIYLININCTHMGCQLIWNNAEKTWDCPCHGSRYSATGDVVDGPTFTPLEKIEII